MTFGGKWLVWLRAFLHPAAIAGLIMIAASWFVAGYFSSVERGKAIEEALKQSDSLVRLFEHSTIESIDRFDRTLLLLRKSYEDDPRHFDLGKWVGQTSLLCEDAFQFSLVNADGYQVATTLNNAGPPRYIGYRPHIQKQLHAEKDELIIGEPTMGTSSGRISLQLVRQLRKPDGSVAGLILVSVDPTFIEPFYQSANLGVVGSLTMRSRNNIILAAQGFPDNIVGRKIPLGRPMAGAPDAKSGSYWGAGAIDGTQRLIAFRIASKYPVTFAVGLSESSILNEYRRHRLAYGSVASIVTVLVLIGIGFAVRYQIRLDRSQADLELTNARFTAALRNMSQGLCLFDPEQRVVVANARYAEIYRLGEDQVKPGTSLRDILRTRNENGSGIVTEPSAYLNFDIEQVDVTEELADGRVVAIKRQKMANGGWLTTHEDVTERRRAEAEIIHLARHDVLTGLANRAEFNSRLEEACRRLKRNGGNVTVMMLDLDRFKAINDTLGHLAGDQLLSEVGWRLQSTVRDTDVLARLGGDEFAIIQEGGEDQYEGAVALARRIIDAVSAPFDLNGQEVDVGVSIGIAVAPENAVEPGELLKCADLALYSVKSSGRNYYRLFRNEMLELVRAQQSAERELREAIAQGQFELHYQPVVDIKTRELVAVETLVRWRHPARGMIQPDHFIPLAESTGLIVPLGDWILERACADAAIWPRHVKVAVNISAIQFKRGDLFETVLNTLMKTGLGPERLELEITETALLENQEAHLTTIRQLKNLGLSIALDDFGTGFSSINYLTIFPFNKIKIDKSFTKGVLSRADCQAVVASTLALAKGLGIITTVEGVETEEQLDYMRDAGVELAQGFLFGKPVPTADFGRDSAVMLTALVA